MPLGLWNEGGEMGGVGDTWGRREIRTEFWWWSLKKRDHLEDLVVDGRIILKYIFKKWVREARTALLWFRVGKRGGLL